MSVIFLVGTVLPATFDDVDGHLVSDVGQPLQNETPCVSIWLLPRLSFLGCGLRFHQRK